MQKVQQGALWNIWGALELNGLFFTYTSHHKIFILLLIVIIFNKFHNNFLFWLYLQHFQNKTEKWCGFNISTKCSSNVFQTHRFVNQ